MATRLCPECGSQYVASVRRCIDCDVILVDEVSHGDKAEKAVPATRPSGDQVAYELAGWGNQLRVTLEGMLDKAGIRRVWESGALLVPAADEETVDQLVATVEGGEVVELADDNSPQIAFEIEGIGPDELDDLDARLIAAQIAHAWDEEGALLIGEADEDAVAELIDAVLEGPDEDEVDGLDTQAALSELYVAVDKLMKHPMEPKLRLRYIDAAAGIEDLGVPYGLAGSDWKALVDEIVSLREAVAVPEPELEDDDPDDGDEADASDDDSDTDADSDTDGDSDADGEDEDSLSEEEKLATSARSLRTNLQLFV